MLSFIFALAESSLFSLSHWQTKRLAEQSPRLASVFNQLINQPQDLLATIVLGNTLANATIGGVSILMVLRSEWLAWVTFPATGLLLLLGCELIPKTLAVRLPERWAISLLRPVAWLQKFLRPIHLIAQKTNETILRMIIPDSVKRQNQATEEDYHELVKLGAQTGTLDEDEKEIILEILSLDEKLVRDIISPKSQMATIPWGIKAPEMIKAATKFRHSRLLLQDENGIDIVGVLDAQSLLLNPSANVESLMEVPTFIPETMNLQELFASFQDHRRRLAVVLDEYGEITGVVTIEDILEEIMGPVFDPTADELSKIQRLSPNRWQVSGLTTIEDFTREYEMMGTIPEINTMGGLMASLLAHIPTSTVQVDYRGLRLTAHRTGERRIEELTVEKLPSERTRS